MDMFNLPLLNVNLAGLLQIICHVCCREFFNVWHYRGSFILKFACSCFRIDSNGLSNYNDFFISRCTYISYTDVFWICRTMDWFNHPVTYLYLSSQWMDLWKLFGWRNIFKIVLDVHSTFCSFIISWPITPTCVFNNGEILSLYGHTFLVVIPWFEFMQNSVDRDLFEGRDAAMCLQSINVGTVAMLVLK